MKNKAKYWVLMSFCILAFLGMGGCSKKTADQEDGSGFTSLDTVAGMEGGILYQGDGLVEFYHVSNDKSLPLCTKANCQHTPYHGQSVTCTAALLYQQSTGIAMHQDRLWLYALEEGMVIVSSADANGENLKELCRFPGEFVTTPLIFSGDFLYLVNSSGQWDEDGQLEGMSSQVQKISLLNGKAETILPEELLYYPAYGLIGIYQKQLYYVLNSYVDKEEEELGATLYVLDLESGETKPCLSEGSRIGLNTAMDGKWLGYSLYENGTYTAYLMDLQTKEQKKLTEPMEQEIQSFWITKSDVVYYVRQDGFYHDSAETGERKKIRPAGEDIAIFAGLEEGYVVGCNGSDMAYISKEVFLPEKKLRRSFM